MPRSAGTKKHSEWDHSDTMHELFEIDSLVGGALMMVNGSGMAGVANKAGVLLHNAGRLLMMASDRLQGLAETVDAASVSTGGRKAS